MHVLTVNLNGVMRLDDDQFYQLCAHNPNLRFERTAGGELVIMSPVGFGGSSRNAKLTQRLMNWLDSSGTGVACDSSGGFILPDGAIRSPDAAWLAQERWQALSAEQQEKFLPLCPDFIVELRSASDALGPLQQKLQEYLDNGLRLGWLINPQDRQVEIYRPGRPVEVLDAPANLSGEEVLPGFTLDLEGVLH